MPQIDASRLPDETLQSYDQLMVECSYKLERTSVLAMSVWTDVLKELDSRGKVRLASGSYNDIGNALIQRKY